MCALCNLVLGWHFMPAAEGRRDLYAAVYQFFEAPPFRIFFDFACGSEEYCSNRIPNFFYLTTWFHDIFHGYDHTHCTSCQSFSRIAGKQKYDTSACEQMNKILKYMGPSIKGMRWDKACLFAQVFVFVVNRKREWMHKRKLAEDKRVSTSAGVASNTIPVQ